MHEAPPQPMKPANRNAEKAMKSCNSRNDIKKSRLSLMLPLGITVAIIAFLMAIQFRGQGNELNGTWWDNEWMDEEDVSNDMTIQQRLRETKMEENKERRNAQKRKKDGDGKKQNRKKNKDSKKKSSKVEKDSDEPKNVNKEKGKYSGDEHVAVDRNEEKNRPTMAREVGDEEKWVGDEEFQALADTVGCDFTVLSALDRNGNVDKNFKPPAHFFRKRIPFVVRGLTLDWPATNDDSWQRYRLIERFGNASIPTDSQGAVVFTGGGGDGSDASKFNTLTSVMDKMREKGTDDSFTFDASILSTIPELREDIQDPEFTREWLSEEKEKKKDAWHMLSLGGSRQGLPYHVHGVTYLSLIHGRKWWMIYPPGAQPPLKTYNITNPMQTMEYYVKNVLPTLMDLPLPPLENGVRQSIAEGFRPFQCVQEAGDILYLPEGWVHQTVNVGETIGIGAQSVWNQRTSLEEKYEEVTEMLKMSPANFDFHKRQLMTTHEMGVSEEKRMFGAILASTQKGMVKFSPNISSDSSWLPRGGGETYVEGHDFNDFILKGEDSWLVLFLPHQPGEQSKKRRTNLSALWDLVAQQLHSKISVGFAMVPLDVWNHPGWAKEMRLTPEEYWDSAVEDESTPQRMRIKFIGGGRPRGMTQSQCMEKALDIKLELTKANVPKIAKIAYDAMKSTPGATEGSATGITAKSRRLFREAEIHGYKILNVQPYHPEVITLLMDTLIYANKTKHYQDAINYFIGKFDPLYDNLTNDMPAMGLSKTGLASVYHKLATKYMDLGKADDALPLLNKSRNLMPTYARSVVDTANAYILLEDITAVERVIEEAVEIGISKDHASLKPTVEFVQEYYANLTKKANGTLDSTEGQGEREETLTKIDTSDGNMARSI